MYKKLRIMWTIVVLLFTTAHTFSIEEDDLETGELELTEEQYRQFVNDENNFLETARTGAHQYSALKSILDRIIDKQPVDCFGLYKKYMEENKETFQKLANKMCRNYRGCWCCEDSSVCISFIVQPNRLCLKWEEPIFKGKILVFEPQLDVMRI